MRTFEDIRRLITSRVGDEIGTLYRDAPERVALVYPSPYNAGMSSLGYQAIYREIHNSGRAVERAFLPDDVDAWRSTRTPLVTYESIRDVSDFPVLAFSVAYELEIAGMIQCLELAGIPVFAEDRDERHPFILMGGPLTFSNPLPLAPYADAILMGEAEESIHVALDILFSISSREKQLEALAREIPSCFVPALHGDEMPKVAAVAHEKLPAYGQIVTPNTELRDMFLIEPERGCSRGCTYCVMRRSTNGGMRLVAPEKIYSLIPDHAKRVGLVGAAVTDHPKISDIVEHIASTGRSVSISSLRADRLNDRLVAALKAGGYRTLTTASDGASERLRDIIQRKTKEKHLIRAAELARLHGMKGMKLYMMVGLPDELDEDIDELIRFGGELSKIIPMSFGVAPFVAKRNTPLDGQPFAGMPLVEARMERLRKGLRGRVDVRATSARWAWVEYVLAMGGRAEGRAVYDAVQNGGGFSAWKKAFAALPEARPKRALRIVA